MVTTGKLSFHMKSTITMECLGTFSWKEFKTNTPTNWKFLTYNLLLFGWFFFTFVLFSLYFILLHIVRESNSWWKDFFEVYRNIIFYYFCLLCLYYTLYMHIIHYTCMLTRVNNFRILFEKMWSKFLFNKKKLKKYNRNNCTYNYSSL